MTEQTILFVYDLNGQLIGEYHPDGSVIREYVYLDGTPLAQIDSSENLHYYLNDHLGTPQKMMDQTQQVVWEAQYTPFGLATVDEDVDGDGNAVTNNLRFPGQYHDEETGLSYNYFRTYDPKTGRYVESDPIGLRGGLNTYLYALASPFTNIDPFGLDCVNVNNRMTCSVPGGSSFTLPAPPGFPNQLGPDDFFYHATNVSRDLDGADPECVFRELSERPTPGYPNPATSEGTKNNAEVPGFGDNIVTSYQTSSNGTGIPMVVNTAGRNDGSAFGPGYVARYVQDGKAHTTGEGANWKQSVDLVSDFANELLWGRDLERIIEKCKCHSK